VSNRDWPAANVTGPFPPYAERVVVELRDRALLAPEKQHGAGDLSVAAVRVVLLRVQRRGCAKFLADRVDGSGIGELLDVFGAHLGWEGVLHRRPGIEHEVDKHGRRRADELLGHRFRCGQKDQTQYARVNFLSARR